MVDTLTYAWDPLAGAYFLASLVVFTAAVGVLLYGRLAPASRRFFVVGVVSTGWLATLGLAVLAADPSTEFIWLRATWILDPFSAPALYWLVLELTGVRRRTVGYAVWGAAVGFAVLSAGAPSLVQGLESATRHYTLTGYGWLGGLYLLYVLTVVALAVGELVRSRSHSPSPAHRVERGVLLAATAFAALTLVDYWIPTEVYRAGPLTPPALILAATAGAWVAVRYRVFSVHRTFGMSEVLSAMSDAVLLLDEHGRIHGANRAASELLGAAEEVLSGVPVSMYLRTEKGDEEWIPEPGDTIRDRQLRLRAPTGERIAVSVAAEPLVKRGRQVGTVVVARDIRDRLAAEKKLKLQRRYFEDLFDNIPEAIVLVDDEDRVLRMNEEFTRLFGYTESEVVGRKIEDLIVSEDQREEGRELARTVASGESMIVETVRRRKDGSEVDVSILARRLEIPGEPLQMYAIYRDISEQKAAERKLREREEELRHAQKMEAVGTLAGGVAHDFNNLMTVINGHVRFALDDLSDPERVRADLEEIERAGTRAANLTQQLLAFGRRQVLRTRVLSVNDVVRDMERMLGRLVGEHTRIETELCGTECNIMADRTQLEQVLVNLAINARDAMPDGGILTVRTEAVDMGPDHPIASVWGADAEEAVRLTVADTGVGIDARTLEQIFDPFFTTKERGKGTGLGLSTVFGIVKQSGGHVVAESEPGEGTRIAVYLPRAEPEDGATEAAVASTTVEAGRAPEPEDRTVLVVEDEDGVRGLVARVIERGGNRVLTASDGAEALAMLEDASGPPDLLLTDMVMPDIGGRELARRLRERWPDLPVLFMSGYDEELVADGAEESELLAKPFTPALLARRVAEILTPRP